jgi:FKBP-type peptidyl-prolyl cis-trans isomerase FkpA
MNVSGIRILAVLLGITQTTFALSAEETGAMSEHDKTLYYLGTTMSRNIQILHLSDAELEVVLQGLRASLAGDAAALDGSVYARKLNDLGQQRMLEYAAIEKSKARAYLDEMAAEEGAIRTDSGLVYLEVKQGKGVQPGGSSSVTVHYQGTLRDGTVFDSSYQRGQPLTIALTDVLPCWREGVPMMKAGGRARLTCPPEIAYGDRASGFIPPGAALTFEVDLIDVLPE